MKIGIQELLVVFIVALIVVGPDKLPYYAKKLGQAFGQFRKYTEEATKDIRESIVEPLNEAQKPLREAMEPVTELEKDIQNNMKDIKKSFSDIGKPAVEKTRKSETDEPDNVSSAEASSKEQEIVSTDKSTAAGPEYTDSAENITAEDTASDTDNAEAV